MAFRSVATKLIMIIGSGSDMPEKFNPNSFAPFLDAIKKSETKGKPPDSTPIRILHKLAAEPTGQMEAGALLSTSELPIDRFAAALREFEAAGFLTTTMDGGRQVVVLKPLGEQVARVKL
jgi:hypothetical protein